MKGYTKAEKVASFLFRIDVRGENECWNWKGCTYNGGYGSPACYATYIWTNQRTLWVTTYDGSTYLSSAPRNPISTMPEMSGGG